MKIAVECKSPLLQKSLELFLEKDLSSRKQCDIVIRDIQCLNDERCFFISNEEGSDLTKPFSKSQLIIELEKKYKILSKKNKATKSSEDSTIDNTPLEFDILEKRIDFLTQEYKENIIRAVKVFYEK